ncbi:hypothetical protein Q4Q35_05450 [Flavivirga aquimarina]|uniref:Transporter n=1 Tax=Flavivirga aquimarina TaxID=2027862 RepID=A0ABT8W854_9FLAO|nr:hypothetical protein [Flavivirga aquimarina]MDO5969247.1 hypothetical protein [Flavivirga aquimarina]
MMIDLQSFNRKIVLLVFLLFQILRSEAHVNNPPCGEHELLSFMCDLCSCSTSSGSFGFGTLSNTNFIGLRYIYQNFESKDGIFENSLTSMETFNTYQLWAQVPLNEKVFLSVNIPYQDLERKIDNTTESINGIGDGSVMGWYKLQFYKKQKDSVDFNMNREVSGHSLLFGIGLKLPTGKFEEALADNVNPGFQVGTGSFDGIFSMGYNYGKDKFGVNTLMSYYLKGENKNEYRFGNQFSYSMNFYTVFQKEKINIMPFIGFSGDIYDAIIQYGETLKDTDGNITNATIGSEVILKKIILGVNYTLPVHQDLFGGNVESKNRFSLYLNYAL